MKPLSSLCALGLDRGGQAGRENEIVLINKVRGTQARSRGKRFCVGLWKTERGADVEEKGLGEKRRREKTWQQAQTHERDSRCEQYRGSDQ